MGGHVDDEGVEDLLGDGSLLKRILVKGEGPYPKHGKSVEVHYETTVQSTGCQIDSTYERSEPFDFFLGEGDVLEAWDIGVATMRPGEKSEFTVGPDLAYGEDGAGDDIPPDATMIFVIELLSGKPKAAAPSTQQLPGEEQRLERATQAKERGNALIKSADFEQARAAYEEALSVIQPMRVAQGEAETVKSRNRLQCSCFLNLALCDLKLEDFKAATKHASQALELQPCNEKALYRRGFAQLANGDLEAAKADLYEASRLDPQNVEVRKRLEECKAKLTAAASWRKEAFGGIFGKTQEQQPVSRDLAMLPRVWMDFQIGDSAAHRVSFALYRDNVPRTAENFLALCTGRRGLGKCGQPLHYKRTRIHRLVHGNSIEAGDIQNYDGSGGESIYGKTFPDESFANPHWKRGLLSMSNRGPNTNDSRFFIAMRSLQHLDNKHVVFGEVVSGMYVLDAIEALETEDELPKLQVSIVDCGSG